MSHGELHLVTVLAAVVVFVAGTSAALGLRLLLRGRGDEPGPVTLPHLIAAGALMTAALYVVIRVSIPHGLVYFGVIRLFYVNAVITLPLGGLALLLAGRRVALTPAVRGLAWVSLAAAPIGAYATFVEPFQVRLERAVVEVPQERRGDAVIRVGVLSDIQTFEVGAHEHDAIDRLMAEEPDIVLLPGDIFHPCHRDERDGALTAIRELLRKIDPPHGAWAVVGDVEAPWQLRMMCEGTPVVPLVNETARVEVKGRVLTICGYYSGGWGASEGYLRRAQDLRGDDGSGDGGSEDDVRILLMHHPDPILELDLGSRIDLAIAGHTHGGQVVVPFFGPPLTLSAAPRDVCAGGLHEVFGNRIYVSRGLGWEHGQAPRVRFLAPPEVTLIEIR